MKIENELFSYYEERISRVNTPGRNISVSANLAKHKNRLLIISAAAVIVLSFIPFMYRIGSPSALAVKASFFCNYYELDTRIPEGLFEFINLTSNSSFSGGNK